MTGVGEKWHQAFYNLYSVHCFLVSETADSFSEGKNFRGGLFSLVGSGRRAFGGAETLGGKRNIWVYHLKISFHHCSTLCMRLFIECP